MVASPLDEVSGEGSDGVRAKALTVMRGREEDVDSRVPVHRVVLLVVLDGPDDLAVERDDEGPLGSYELVRHLALAEAAPANGDLGLVQDRQVGGEVEAPAHDHGERIRDEALGQPLLTQLLRLRHAPIALRAQRARPDHHGIGLRAEVMEEPPVEVRREALGAPLDRRLAVETRDHVEPEPGPAGRRQLSEPHAAGHLLG